MVILPSAEMQPYQAFLAWFDEAHQAITKDPNAFVLSTVAVSGAPSSRVLLLKGYAEDSFHFYTNYHSRKAQELDAHSPAAIHFYWRELDAQIRIEGKVSRLDAAISDAYFASRPRESQLSAWASRQSTPLAAYAEFEARLLEMEAKFAGATIPRPPFWGGYELVAARYEFWHQLPYRRHERRVFVREGTGWQSELLYP
jgi:pyridoxamine 5'-phosphate oxidase